MVKRWYVHTMERCMNLGIQRVVFEPRKDKVEIYKVPNTRQNQEVPTGHDLDRLMELIRVDVAGLHSGQVDTCQSQHHP